jgi:hypothetical protein
MDDRKSSIFGGISSEGDSPEGVYNYISYSNIDTNQYGLFYVVEPESGVPAGTELYGSTIQITPTDPKSILAYIDQVQGGGYGDTIQMFEDDPTPGTIYDYIQSVTKDVKANGTPLSSLMMYGGALYIENTFEETSKNLFLSLPSYDFLNVFYNKFFTLNETFTISFPDVNFNIEFKKDVSSFKLTISSTTSKTWAVDVGDPSSSAVNVSKEITTPETVMLSKPNIETGEEDENTRGIITTTILGWLTIV